MGDWLYLNTDSMDVVGECVRDSFICVYSEQLETVDYKFKLAEQEADAV